MPPCISIHVSDPGLMRPQVPRNLNQWVLLQNNPKGIPWNIMGYHGIKVSTIHMVWDSHNKHHPRNHKLGYHFGMTLRIEKWNHLSYLSDHDYYMVKPEKTVPIFSYTPGLGNVKFSTAASAFSAQAWLPFDL